jgi:hypothetical protein
VQRDQRVARAHSRIRGFDVGRDVGVASGGEDVFHSEEGDTTFPTQRPMLIEQRLEDGLRLDHVDDVGSIERDDDACRGIELIECPLDVRRHGAPLRSGRCR